MLVPCLMPLFSTQGNTDDLGNAIPSGPSAGTVITGGEYLPTGTSALTHWGRNKMAAIFHTTFSNSFSLMKIYELRLRFHKFVPKVRIDNIPALVQIMAWRRPGDKPLSEPMMVQLLTHICVTRPQWVNSLAPGRCGRNLKYLNFNLTSMINILSISYEIALRGMAQDLIDDQPVGSSSGLVPSGNNPLPEPMLTKMHVTIWLH